MSVLLLALAFAPAAFAAPKPDTTPNVASCATWVRVASTSVSHDIGTNHYTGTVSLYKLVDATNGNAYCQQMRADASLQVPLGALSANVQAELLYQTYGSPSAISNLGPLVTVSSGGSGTSQAYPKSGDAYNGKCAQARGHYSWPDGQTSTPATLWVGC